MSRHRQAIGIVTAAVLGLVWPGLWAWGQAAGFQQPPPGAKAGETQPQPLPAPAGPHPRIVFDSTEYDFGRISDDQKITVEFRFRNAGDMPLIFREQPKASCGCTAGTLPKLEYAPGESGVLTATFDPHGKHGDQRHWVSVSTNDPTMPEVKCNFYGYVRRIITIDPPLVGFGEVLAGESARQVIRIRGPRGFAATYASNTQGRHITVKVLGTQDVEADGEPMSESTLEFTITGKPPRGELRALATVRTNHPKHRLLDVQINGTIVGDLQVLPPRLAVGVLEAGESFSRVFRVASRTGKPFRILGVETLTNNTGAPLDVRFAPAEPGSATAYQVEVKGTAPGAGTPINATLAIRTDRQEEETVEVAMNGLVRMPAASALEGVPPGVFVPQQDTGPSPPRPGDASPGNKPKEQ